MSKKFIRMQEILDRNTEQKLNLNENFVAQFYFSHIKSEIDAEEVWGLFEERADIQLRMSQVLDHHHSDAEWGTLIGGTHEASKKMAALMLSFVSHLRKVMPEYLKGTIIGHFDDDLEVVITEQEAPLPEDNDFRDIITDCLYAYVSKCKYREDEKHYRVLFQWLRHLTQSYELAFYIMWPCYNHRIFDTLEVAEPLAKLIKADCLDCFWISDNTTQNKVLNFTPWW